MKDIITPMAKEDSHGKGFLKVEEHHPYGFILPRFFLRPTRIFLRPRGFFFFGYKDP